MKKPITVPIVGNRADGKQVVMLVTAWRRIERKLCRKMFRFAVTKVNEGAFTCAEESTGLNISGEASTIDAAEAHLEAAIKRYGERFIRDTIERADPWQESLP